MKRLMTQDARGWVCAFATTVFLSLAGATHCVAQYDMRGLPVIQNEQDIQAFIHAEWQKHQPEKAGGRQPELPYVFASMVAPTSVSPMFRVKPEHEADYVLIKLLDGIPPQSRMSLSGNAVTDKAIAHLKLHKHALQMLSLRGPFNGDGLTDTNLWELQHLSLQIEAAQHKRPTISDGCLQAVAKWKKLEGLTLIDCNLDDAQLPMLSALKDLKVLILGGNRLCGKTLVSLQPMPHLEAVILESNRLRDRDLSEFPSFPLANTLSLKNNPVGDKGLHCILAADLPRLERLNLGRTNVTEEVFFMLGDRQIEVNLDQAAINYQRLRERNPAAHLKRLVLSDTGLTDYDLDVLQSFAQLELVDISSNDVSDAVIDVLVGMPSLQMVCLGRTRVTANGVTRLKMERPEVIVWPAYTSGYLLPAIAEPGGSRWAEYP